jgi:hypothetical protein
MSRSDDPSSRTAPRKKPSASTPDAAPAKHDGRTKAKKPRCSVSFDSDFGLAMAIVPSQRRPEDG